MTWALVLGSLGTEILRVPSIYLIQYISYREKDGNNGFAFSCHFMGTIPLLPSLCWAPFVAICCHPGLLKDRELWVLQWRNADALPVLYPGLCWASVPASDHTQPCPDAWLHTEDYSIQLGYAADMLVSVQPQTAGFRWFPSRLDAWFCPFQFDDLFCQQLDDPLEYVYIMYTLCIHYVYIINSWCNCEIREMIHTHTHYLTITQRWRKSDQLGRANECFVQHDGTSIDCTTQGLHTSWQSSSSWRALALWFLFHVHCSVLQELEHAKNFKISGMADFRRRTE